MNKKKISLFERKVKKKKEPSALFVCPALEKEEKNSIMVTNFERIKKKT